MITINSGKLIIPEEDRFIGFAGDNLHSKKQFLIENETDKNCIYRLYLKFDDDTVNYFVLDSKVENGSTILTWNISEEHIFKSGIVSAQIKSISDSGETYHTTRDYFIVAAATEFSDNITDNENAEFLRYEKELNEIYKKINETDLDSFVTNSRTIAGLNLADNIYVEELYEALKVYPIMIKEGAPTFNYGEAGCFLVDTLNGDFYYCDKRTLSGYNWIKLTGTSESSSGLKNVDINENGELILTFSNGTTNNLGVVVGKNGYTPIKGTDYFTEEDKQELIDELKLNEESMPEYWRSALNEGVHSINTALCEAGYNKSAFLFYSDAHFNYGSQMSPALLKYLYKHTGINKTIFGGDIVNDEANDYNTMEYLWQWRSMLKGLPNHHSVIGNHDDGNSTNNLFPENYVYGYLLGAEETPDIIRGEKGIYYYIDSPAEKTRYLYLDTAYKGVDDAQLAFVKEALIGTPDNWHIVAIAHTWYQPDYNQYNVRPIPISGFDSNASKIVSLLDAYNSRNGDYKNCGGWVEFCIGGHVHIDYDGVTSTGIPIILVETDSFHTRSGLSATKGSITEASVNAVIANYAEHKISVIRIGRGESREVKITNYPISYTNVLPSALAFDGSIYNGTGYKADTRWSQSGQSEQSQSGAYITGWIPVSTGDVIYLKNINALSTASTTVVFLCSDLGSTTGGSNATSLTDYHSAVWDENDNLIQFTVTDYAYIRLQCGGIDETSVITINEAIE